MKTSLMVSLFSNLKSNYKMNTETGIYSHSITYCYTTLMPTIIKKKKKEIHILGIKNLSPCILDDG